MKTPFVLFLAGLALFGGVSGCKREKLEVVPLKPAADPAVKTCSTAKDMEECSACCTAEFNSRFMGGKCDCFQR